MTRFGRIIAVWLCFVLTGCGFQLRNQNTLPPQFHRIYIESVTPYGDFETTLRHSLERIGVIVTRCKQDAQLVLHIDNSSLFNEPPTIGGSNQARVYHFYFQVTYDVRNYCNRALLPPQSVRAADILIVNPGEALESTHQLDVLRLELQEEVSHMMINKLNSPQLCNSLLQSQ